MASTSRDNRPSVADMVAELTAAHTQREHYAVRRGKTWYGQQHQVTAPSLLEQLGGSLSASSSVEGGHRPGYGSRPAANLEALDCLTRIDHEAAQWVRHLGHDDPGSTAAVIRRLHSLTPSLDEATRREVERDVRRWRTQARIVSGWDSAPWRPDNTCPLCEHHGGLRIKLAEQLGFCVECGETWPAETIGLLADHIREENTESVGA